MPDENVFALLRAPADQIRRIKLTAPVQASLGDVFQRGLRTLISPDLEPVPFEGSYRPDESEVLYIQDFAVPDEVWTALNNPMACEPLTFDGGYLPSIKAIFTGSAAPTPWVSWQVFRSNQFLTRRGISIILSGDTFRRLEEPGINIGESVEAHFREERLYFRSYHEAKSCLDLSAYYREATDKDVQAFAALQTVEPEDPATLERNADTWVRRKIAMIQDRGILNAIDPQKLTESAASYGVPIAFTGTMEQPRILLPNDKKQLKNLLKFLDEDYYTGHSTGQRYATNSKRKIT